MRTVNTEKGFTSVGALTYLLKGSVAMFSAGIAASLVITFLNMLVPEVISFSIDSIIGNEEVPAAYAGIILLFGGIDYLKQNIWIVAAFLLAIALISAAFIYLRTYCNTRANQIFTCRMRDKLFSHIQRLPLSWHNVHRTGDIIQRCTSDAEVITNFVSAQLITLFRIIILIVFSLVFMFMKNVKLALISSAFIPLFLGYSLFFIPVQENRLKNATRKKAFCRLWRRKTLRARAWFGHSAEKNTRGRNLKNKTFIIRDFG